MNPERTFKPRKEGSNPVPKTTEYLAEVLGQNLLCRAFDLVPE